MSPTLFRLVLFVSCAHALVHVYELAFPSSEQLIAQTFDVSKITTGQLGTCFALPFGLFALAVGWVTDQVGAKRMLVTYLCGCAATSGAIWWVEDINQLFVAMFVLGSFASIYHPAGLALLSHETSRANRTRALGLHGIFGSAGIGAAPFIAGFVLDGLGFTWQQYYALLMLPGFVLGYCFWRRLTVPSEQRHSTADGQPPLPVEAGDDDAQWTEFFLVTLFGATMGLIYRAVVTFLPRYLDGADISWSMIGDSGMRNYLTGGVLLIGIVGQYLAGRIARPHRLEQLLTFIVLGNIPLLIWMALATGPMRIFAAGSFALVHFMNQPVYNSLIAVYSPRRRRSLCYGFSFMMSFGIGSFGSTLAGYAPSDIANYARLAGIAAVASLFPIALWAMSHADQRRRKALEPLEPPIDGP